MSIQPKQTISQSNSSLFPLNKILFNKHLNKLQDLVKRIFSSHLAQLSLQTIVGITITLSISYFAIYPPLTFAISAIFISYIVNNLITKRYELFYESSLYFTLLKSSISEKLQPWHSKITDNIYLGSIPLKEKKSLEFFKKENIKVVLSLNEDFEFENTLFATPLKKEDLEKEGITLRRINAKDFNPVPLDKMNLAVQILNQEIAKGNKVYVHCKAGRGRSASIVCANLIQNNKWKTQQAIDFVQSKRKNISLRVHRKQIEKFEKAIQKERLK